jgi:hypothetical protein
MNQRTQVLCAWAGVACTVVFFVGFSISGFITPPSPNSGPDEIAQMFRDNQSRIRVGILICSLGAALVAPWSAVIGVQLRRIEGRYSPLAYTQMISGACLVMEFLFPLMAWQAAAFRTERSPELIQAINDLAWLPFLGIACTSVVQGFAIGIVILRDRAAQPAFPRWAGYFNIWIVLMFAPASAIVFFHDGPLAWNGIIAWWLALTTFFLWIVVTTWVLIRAIRQQAREEADLAGMPSGELPCYDELVADVAQLQRALAATLDRGHQPLK